MFEYCDKNYSLEEFDELIRDVRSNRSDYVEVIWTDKHYTVDSIYEVFYPLIERLRKEGCQVHAIIEQDVAKKLVRYPKAMFVDPIFLLKFKFKSIRFTLSDPSPDLDKVNQMILRTKRR